MLRRQAPARVRTAFVTISAFTILFASGCGDDTAATPRVTLNTSLGQSPTAGAPECTDASGSFFSIGDFGNPNNASQPSRPVDDGGDDQGGTVGVNCSVTPTPDGFTVRASATLDGERGGSFNINGAFLNGQTSTGIAVSTTRRGSTYQQDDCTATFDGVPTLQGGPIAAGRVWTYITCPNARDGAHDRTCQSITQIRLENCGQ